MCYVQGRGGARLCMLSSQLKREGSQVASAVCGRQDAHICTSGQGVGVLCMLACTQHMWLAGGSWVVGTTVKS